VFAQQEDNFSEKFKLVINATNVCFALILSWLVWFFPDVSELVNFALVITVVFLKLFFSVLNALLFVFEVPYEDQCISLDAFLGNFAIFFELDGVFHESYDFHLVGRQ